LYNLSRELITNQSIANVGVGADNLSRYWSSSKTKAGSVADVRADMVRNSEHWLGNHQDQLSFGLRAFALPLRSLLLSLVSSFSLHIIGVSKLQTNVTGGMGGS
jgi:hypothetical protein